MLIDKNLLKQIILSETSTILEVINNLNKSELKIVLVEDKNKKFSGIINDGDIVYVRTTNLHSPTAALHDSHLVNNTIEIRVYEWSSNPP